MENQFDSLQVKTANRLNVVAISALFLILIAEWRTPYVSVASPLSLLVIGFLALKLRPRQLYIWVLTYTFFAATAIYLDRIHWPVEGKNLRFIIRVSNLIVGNGIALGLSIYRSRLEDSYLQMLDIFRKIPSALIVSNDIGNIIAVNEETARIVGITTSELMGDSYFKYFGIGPSKGDSVRKYLELMENPPLEPETFEIMVLPCDLSMSGTLVALQMQAKGGERCILTTLHPEPWQIPPFLLKPSR